MLTMNRIFGGEIRSNVVDVDCMSFDNSVDSVYNSTFVNFFDHMIQVDDLSKELSNELKAKAQSTTKEKLRNLILSKVKSTNKNPFELKKQKYESEILSICDRIVGNIQTSFFDYYFHDIVCEAYMPHFIKAGLTVDEMKYLVSCYKYGGLKEYRTINEKYPFLKDVKNYVQTFYQRYKTSGKIPALQINGSELRKEYDRLYDATHSDEYLDNIIKSVVLNNISQEDYPKFHERCREGVKNHRLSRYGLYSYCLKTLPEVLNSPAYSHYIQGLGECDKNLEITISSVTEKFTEHFNSDIDRLVSLNADLLWTSFAIAYDMIPEQSLVLTVEVPGTLSKLLSLSDKKNLTHLKVEGCLNASDIKILRAMMGNEEEVKLLGICGSLQYLDISDIVFAESEEGYKKEELQGRLHLQKRGENNQYELYDFSNMSDIKWNEFKLNVAKNILSGDDFELVLVGKQVYRVSKLKSGIVGGELFTNCIYLKEIKLPDNTRKINEHAFSGCNLIEKIVLPSNTTTLEDYAFSQMSGIKTVQTNGPNIVVVKRNDSLSRSQRVNSKKITSIFFTNTTPSKTTLFYESPNCEGLIYLNNKGKFRQTTIDYKTETIE